MTASLLVSCGGGGGDGAGGSGGGGNPGADITQTISNLKPGTTYHWKVRADDGKGGAVDSEPRTFTTQ